MSLAKQIMLLTSFHRLRGGYNNEPSLFDNISQDDLILAFFPCTRFEARVPLLFRGEATQQKRWSNEQKLNYSIQLQNELTELYILLCKMVVVCERKGLRMVIENPYTQPHYLTTYWCIRPALIDKDRTENGDYFKKPTQFFFINCEPKFNFIFEPIEYVETMVISKVKKKDNLSVKTQRSLIHPQYASRFIRQYLIEQE